MLGRFGVGPPSERDDVVRISLDSGLIARESFHGSTVRRRNPRASCHVDSSSYGYHQVIDATYFWCNFLFIYCCSFMDMNLNFLNVYRYCLLWLSQSDNKIFKILIWLDHRYWCGWFVRFRCFFFLQLVRLESPLSVGICAWTRASTELGSCLAYYKVPYLENILYR